MNPKLFTTRIMSLLAMSLLLNACGASTNPTEDYSDLPKAKIQTQKNEPQGLLPGDLFFVRVPGVVQFVEGQAIKPVLVKISSRLKGIQFRLQATGLPRGISMSPVDAANPMGDYVIQGTVPVGTSTGLPQGTSSKFQVEAVDIGGDKVQSTKLKNELLHSWESEARVYPTDHAPILEPMDPSKLMVTEGESLEITFVVKDEGATQGNVPEIVSPFRNSVQSGEVELVDAGPGLRVKATPEAIGENRFKYTAVLNTSMLKLPAGTKDVTARFLIGFRSMPSRLPSADEIIDVKIVRLVPVAAPAPTPAAAPQAVAPQAVPPKNKPKPKNSAASNAKNAKPVKKETK